jgi:predicted ATPase
VAAALTRLLCTGRRLVVLDNCEHVLDAVPMINDLLTACDGLKVLATSREPLRLNWDHLLPVPPLAVPDPARLHMPQGLGTRRRWRFSYSAPRRSEPTSA